MLPSLIPIKRVPHGVTHSIGRHEGGLFMGFVFEVFPEQKKKPKHGTWYAVLHLFSKAGEHIRTEHFRLSPDGREGVHSQLGAMIRKLSAVSFESVDIAPFDTKIDGTLWGLIDVSKSGADDTTAELRPFGLRFSAPWNGNAEEPDA